MTQTFYSHGKLLLSSEYLVLDGAEALALPTKRGQYLEVKRIEGPIVKWKSILEDGSTWIETTFDLPLTTHFTTANPVEQMLHKILSSAHILNSGFLSGNSGYEVRSTLEFEQNWGLGSSSTLLSNIARWAAVNPYALLKKTFGGSGYDIACATANTPIVYSNKASIAQVRPVVFKPNFRDHIFFVHLNKKQNSRESISHYRSLEKETLEREINHFSSLTQQLLDCKELSQFEVIIQEHEARLSHILKTPTIKQQLFQDYPHTIKSLGGWGGDFILVVGNEADKKYFKHKEYRTIIPYGEMILE